jgi:hypothetical protein
MSDPTVKTIVEGTGTVTPPPEPDSIEEGE